jgi:hypothetical protein
LREVVPGLRRLAMLANAGQCRQPCRHVGDRPSRDGSPHSRLYSSLRSRRNVWDCCTNWCQQPAGLRSSRIRTVQKLIAS